MNRLVPLILVAALGASAGRKPVTPEAAAEDRTGRAIEDIVWAPDGAALVYRHEKSLHLYTVASRRRQQIVSLAALETRARAPEKPERFSWQNRRVRERPVQWFPDGRRLLVKVKGDLFVCPAGVGECRQLTATAAEEADPKLSPDGRSVSFRRAHDLWVAGVESGRARPLTRDGGATRWNAELDWVYPEELDLATAHWWSPDSRHIAYLQFDVSRQWIYPHADLLPLRAVAEPQRYPKAGAPNADVRLGIVPAAGGKTRWLDAVQGEPRGAGGDGSHLIARVHWLPDSSAVAVEKLNRIQNRLELRVAPLRGPGRTLLVEQDPHWVNLADGLTFLPKSRRLLWTSERSGYRHLYLYRMDGTLEAQLTNGDWEVTEVACTDEDRGIVYFESTEQSPLERHLYQVALDGSGRRRLTTDAGTNSALMAPGCGHYLRSFSSFDEPPRKTLHTNGGEQIDELDPPDRSVPEEYEILPQQVVTLATSDGETLYGRLLRPAGFQPSRKYPAVVLVYGGPHAQNVVNRWFGADLAQALGHAGFVVWQLDNRGTAGRGHSWETRLYRRFGRQELADQLEGMQHLLGMGFVDANRVGIHGWSYGGFMTLYAMLHAPDTFRAGVAGAPVTQWRNYDTIYTERYLGLPEENQEGYRLSSPLDDAARLRGPLLLIHNIQDDNVLFQHTLQMADALERAGKPFEMMIYPQKTHGVTGEAKKHFYRAVVDFFTRRLGK